MKALIVGFGSIGQRHYRLLCNLLRSENIDVVSRQNPPNITSYISLQDVSSLHSYDYIVIASETHLHYEQLHYLCSHVKHKTILVEKPLFDVSHKPFKCSNLILTAYNMRFHPVIQKLQALLVNKKIYAANIYCGSYLPRWRPEQDYSKGYSADLSKGGGVLRDLSHELDYVTYLFGNMKTIETIQSKVSDLKITSDDLFTMIGVTERKTVVTLSLDYISKLHRRKVLIHTQDESIEADLIGNTIEIQDKDANTEVLSFPEADRDYTYIKMHEAVLANKFNRFCTFEEGLNITQLIDAVLFKKDL